MEYEYFYGHEGDSFRFVMIPEIMFTDESFKHLSSDAKLLYGLFLGRVALSSMNHWIDENGIVYVVFSIDEIMSKMHCARGTAIKMLDELDTESGIGLIERRRRGLGKPNIIYVKNCHRPLVQNLDDRKFKSCITEVQKLNLRSSKNESTEVQEIDGSYINHNYIDSSIQSGSYTRPPLGHFQNVNLTDDELKNLRKRMGGELESYIERLSIYMKSHNKRYSDHHATLLMWFMRDQEKKPLTNNIPNNDDYDKGEHW